MFSVNRCDHETPVTMNQGTARSASELSDRKPVSTPGTNRRSDTRVANAMIPPHREQLPRSSYRLSNGAVRTHAHARTYSPRAPRPLLVLVHGCGPWASTRARQSRKVCRKCCARESVEITGERDAKQKQKSREEGEGEADGQRSRRELFPRWPTERSIFHGRGVPPGGKFLGNLVVSRGRAR